MASKAGTGTKKARTAKAPTNGNGKATQFAGHNLAPAAATTDVAEQVRRRAYELFEQRGGQHGHHEQDWLQAESELTQRTA